LEKDFLTILNPAQKEAATTFDGPMLILAGAGAGKTHTIISRVACMIKEGIDPKSILLLTFTNKAAEEMIERAKKYCDGRADEITACTYHSFCALMLRRYGQAIGINRNFDILTPSQGVDAIGFTKSLQKNKYALKKFPNNKKASAIFSASINLDISINEVLKMDAYSQYLEHSFLLNELFVEYQHYKSSKSLMDYDDLLVNFYKLLKHCEPVRKRIEDAYKYIMVDEYQDTNNLQSKILHALRKEQNNIAVVGDDAQSIYKFRGANVKNIINFPKEYHGCSEVHLTENYRSSKEILQLANDSYDNCATEGYVKRMNGQFSTGNKPVLIRPLTDDIGDVEVVSGISDLLKLGVPADEICVVARKSRSFFGVEHLLNQENIVYEKRGGQKFLELKSVLDMIAYFRFALNPLDEISLFRLLRLHHGIGDTYASNICGLLGVVDNPIINNKYKGYKFASELKSLHQIFEIAKNIENENVAEKFELFKNFYKETCSRAIMLMKTDELKRNDEYEFLEEQMKNIERLALIAEQYDSVITFLDAIILDQARMEDNQDVKKVVLTTIHSVKGLEFNTVFILGCIDGFFPQVDLWDDVTFDDEDIQEELRCFYVAITRAEERLYLVCPKQVKTYYGVVPAKITRFLDGCEHAYQESDSYIRLS
jgi:Superfamily I DNA and RNA helicases